MLSRRSTRAIADAYQEIFTSSTYSGRHESRTANPQELYDFVYERDYEPWFCNLAGRVHGARGVLDFIIKIHTGESIASATPDWSWDKRRGEGQNLLRRLAEDMLKELTTEARSASIFAKDVEKLARPLELDGYIFKGRRLQREETDVFDVEEVHGVIESLYRELGLANEDVALHHLKNSEEHFVSGKWDDSISHSRRLLEQVLREVASAHSQRKTGSPGLPPMLIMRPPGPPDGGARG
jgi:hypothetical protein